MIGHSLVSLKKNMPTFVAIWCMYQKISSTKLNAGIKSRLIGTHLFVIFYKIPFVHLFMYMNNKTQLKLCLYNIRGFNSSKVDYIIELLKQHSILFIVEHWLSDDKLANVSTHFPGYSV